MSRRRAWVAAGLAAVAWATPVAGHPYGTTTAQLDWRGEHDKLEVAVRALPEQIEKALSQHQGAPFDLDDPAPKTDLALQAYLRATFRAESAAGDVATLRWVGKEVAFDAVWLYFELQFQKPTQAPGLKIRQAMLLDLGPDQLNTVRLKAGGRQQSWVLTRQQDEAVFDPPQP
jgi:hypothetical protein